MHIINYYLSIHLFHLIIAQLDSAVFMNTSSYRKEFTIKDSMDRMPCVFNEIDRKMEKITRGTYVRLVGNYDLDTAQFVCYSVRQASKSEIFTNAQFINLTNDHIQKKYLQ